MDNNSLAHTKWNCKSANVCLMRLFIYETENYKVVWNVVEKKLPFLLDDLRAMVEDIEIKQ